MKQLKSELAALDRKITAALAPKHDVIDGTENKQAPSHKSGKDVTLDSATKTTNVHTTDPPQEHKPSMVAEPQPRYPIPASMPRFTARLSGI